MWQNSLLLDIWPLTVILYNKNTMLSTNIELQGNPFLRSLMVIEWMLWMDPKVSTYHVAFSRCPPDMAHWLPLMDRSWNLPSTAVFRKSDLKVFETTMLISSRPNYLPLIKSILLTISFIFFTYQRTSLLLAKGSKF